MALDEQKEGKLARAMLKHLLKDEGFTINRHFRRRVGNIAHSTGFEFGDVLEFSTTLAGELLAEVSDKDKPPTPDELDARHEHYGHGGH